MEWANKNALRMLSKAFNDENRKLLLALGCRPTEVDKAMGVAGLFNNGILCAAPNTKMYQPCHNLIQTGPVAGVSTHNLMGYSWDQCSRGGIAASQEADRYKCPHQGCEFASNHAGATSNHMKRHSNARPPILWSHGKNTGQFKERITSPASREKHRQYMVK